LRADATPRQTSPAASHPVVPSRRIPNPKCCPYNKLHMTVPLVPGTLSYPTQMALYLGLIYFDHIIQVPVRTGRLTVSHYSVLSLIE